MQCGKFLRRVEYMQAMVSFGFGADFAMIIMASSNCLFMMSKLAHHEA